MTYTIFSSTETEVKTPVCSVARFGDTVNILIGLRAGAVSTGILYTAEKTNNF